MVVEIIERQAHRSLELLSLWMESCENEVDNDLLAKVMTSSDCLVSCDVALYFSESTINKKASKLQGNDYMKCHSQGQPFARMKIFSNLSDKELSIENLIVSAGEQNPIQDQIVTCLRAAFGDIALFFWNSRNAKSIGVLWKPSQFISSKFSVVSTRHTIVAEGSKSIFSIKNSAEIVKEMLAISRGMLTASSF